MGEQKYAVGIDFGTESARALLVALSDGEELASAVLEYEDGVIDERLPVGDVPLEPDWALQNPKDYVRAVKATVPQVLEKSGVPPEDVIGLGIDFTACTMLPTKADGTPLCYLPAYREEPRPIAARRWTSPSSMRTSRSETMPTTCSSSST
ncbi:MAG: hypothetical protein R6V13_04550, partial [Anaerolineae bacterium]